MDKSDQISKMLENIRGLKYLIDNSKANTQVLHEISVMLSQIANSSVYITDDAGKLLLSENIKGVKNLFRLKQGADGRYIDTEFCDQLNAVTELVQDMDLVSFYAKGITKSESSEYKSLVLPITTYGKRHGTLLLIGFQAEFEPDRIVFAEYCCMLISLIMMHERNEEYAEESRRFNIVRSAIGTLSYSELEAMLRIFEELPGSEGLLVASKVADKVGITRSVIVNALRKLESAGVIESRSLGMKGTYIKVLNSLLIDELNKMRR